MEEFVWGEEQERAMATLKKKLTSPPALKPIDYEPHRGRILLSKNSSLIRWGAILQQAKPEDGKKKIPRGMRTEYGRERKRGMTQESCRGQ